jgi:ABC-2 type transport system permease protein
MINLIINELKKIISKKRFFMMFIIMFLITALSIYSTGKNTTSDKLTLYQEVKSTKLQFSLTNGRKQKAESNRSVKNEELISHLNNQLEILEQERELLSKLDKTGSDWRGILKEDIDLIEKKKYFAEKEGEKNVIEDINKELIYKKFFLENNVRYTNKPSTSAFYNMPSVLYYMQRLFLLMLISILVLDIVSGESEAATIKVLLTKPVSRGRVLLSKFLAMVLASNGIILALQGMAFLILGMFFTFGDPNIPFVIGTKYNLDYNLLNQGRKGISAVIGSSSVLPAWEVIIQLILLQIILITTCVAFCILISTIFKSNVAATGTGFFFLVISWIVAFNATDVSKQTSGRTTLTQKIVPYFFETYYDLFALLTGSLSQTLLNPNATVNLFIAVCFTWIIVCYGMTHIIFTRRDVL